METCFQYPVTSLLLYFCIKNNNDIDVIVRIDQFMSIVIARLIDKR